MISGPEFSSTSNIANKRHQTPIQQNGQAVLHLQDSLGRSQNYADNLIAQFHCIAIGVLDINGATHPLRTVSICKVPHLNAALSLR